MNTSLLLLALSALPPTAVPCGDPPRYRVIDLGGSEWGAAHALDVNEWRAVTGYLDLGSDVFGLRHAMLWLPSGQAIDLTPSANIDSTWGTSINNAGVVVGNLTTLDAAPEGGFRWRAGRLEILPSRFQMEAEHVDERGNVVGKAHTAVFHFAPTIWAPDLSYTQLPTLGGADSSAEDRNGWGEVVGWSMLTPTGFDPHAFHWRDGLMTDLGTLPGHRRSIATAVNVRGEVVGSSGPSLQERAVLWTRTGEVIDLGDLGFAPRAFARDMNDHGDIVGYSLDPQGVVATVWIDERIHELNDLVDPASGWRLITAESINERGDIVGLGTFGGGGSNAYLAVREDGGHLAVIGPLARRAGRASAVHIVGGTPGATLALHLGLRSGHTAIPACPSIPVEIKSPRVLTAVADAQGHARFDVAIPRALLGKSVLLQAVELDTCRRSGLVVHSID